ncbi:MAG: ABC transporter substrate-binding protein [Candidatus Thorarchaeota archaeon]
MLKSKLRIAMVIFFLMILLQLSPLCVSGQTTETLQEGPYLNGLDYDIIPSMDNMILAIQDGDIDLVGEALSPIDYRMLESVGDIQVESTPRNGFSIFCINCVKYPFNISSFRRAVAFAFDKQRVISEVWEGLAYLQDCPIPSNNIFSAEGMLDFNYYNANISIANQLLDIAGFLDVDVDGFREAPDGSEFDVQIEGSLISDIDIQTGEILLDAFDEMHIDAELIPAYYDEYLNRLYFHGDYDCVMVEKDYGSNELVEFAFDYWTEYADEPYRNYPNWRNATFDSWRDQLFHATEFEDVYEAAIEMQRIWVEDSPVIIAYQNLILSAYRTDRFEGFINSIRAGVPSWWTNFRTHVIDETEILGGTLKIGMVQDVESFNFMVIPSESSTYVLDNLYDSLIRQAPDGRDVLWLAEAFVAETHEDNQAVPDGYSRFTFDIRHDISWTDGTPLTAEDIAFTLNYYRDAPGNPYGIDLEDLAAAYAISTYRIVTEFRTESYWHLRTIGYKPILPRHVFIDIGIDSWNLWNPDPPEEAMVTSGPFIISDYEYGDYVHLRYNSLYFFGLDDHPTDSSIPGSTLTTDPPLPGLTDNLFGIPGISILNLVITIPSLAVMIIVLIKWRLEKPEMFRTS